VGQRPDQGRPGGLAAQLRDDHQLGRHAAAGADRRRRQPAGLRHRSGRRRQLRGEPRCADPVRRERLQAASHHHAGRPCPRADAGRGHRVVRPGRGVLPRGRRHAAQQVARSQCLRLG
jgi:hypothetical protein